MAVQKTFSFEVTLRVTCEVPAIFSEATAEEVSEAVWRIARARIGDAFDELATQWSVSSVNVREGA